MPPSLTFPTRPEVTKTLLAHPSFFNNMSALDLQARHSFDSDAYMQKYLASIVEVNGPRRKVLASWIAKADAFLAPYARIFAMPWKLVMLDESIESGFPHTQADLIFISESFCDSGEESKKITTLIHEKIHVYQRAYPLQTAILVCNVWHYNLFDLKRKYPLARNNPDLNGVVYSSSKNKERAIVQQYVGVPKSLADSEVTCGSNYCEYEHPFEHMAYYISRGLIKQSGLDKQTLLWMTTYM